MFSFFRRKSKDDGDKKEKPKEKSSFSPFTKRQDSSKKEPIPSNSTQLQFSDSSLTVAAIDTHTLKDVAEENAPELYTTTNTNVPPQHTLNTPSNARDNAQVTSTVDEQQHPLIFCNLPNISESTRTSPVISEEDSFRHESPVVSDSSERAGSSDRDIVFKTAPNTPVLAKHLEIVSDEVVIDGPITPRETSFTVSDANDEKPLGAELDFPSADRDKSEEELDLTSNDFNQTVPETKDSVLEELKKREEKEEPAMCEEMNHHGPGDLYDIAEEETSEEEEDQSEEEEEEEETEDDDDDDSGNVTQPNNEDEYPDEIIKKNQVNRDTRELEARLSASEAESNKLLCRIDDLQRDVMVKSGGMERLQAELNAAYKESEFVKKRLKKLEEDLDVVRQKNAELTEELQKNTEEAKDTEDDGFDFNHLLLVEQQVKELKARVKELETQLEQLRQERNQLEQRARTLEAERLEERRILQEALDNAIAEKQSIQTKFEKDFERLRTENTDREQHLLDDFEWKLREVNQMYKKRLEEKENSCKQRIKTIEDKLKAAEQELTQLERLKQCEAEATMLRGLNLEQQRAQRFAERAKEELQVSEKVLQEEVRRLKESLDKEKAALATVQLERLKQFEAEATMLRGLNLEQQRALRFAERAKEELQVSEKVLQEEVRRLEESLDKEKAALATMQAIHNREIDEKERKMRFRLEQQKTELNNQWEEKLRKETIKLRVELDQINRDDKRMVLQSARLEKEAELQKAKEQWENQFKGLQKEIESLKQELVNSEEEHQNKIDNIRTTADRDLFDLRRKLDRIDISYQDKIEKLQSEHEKEKERLAEEFERRLQSCEQGWQNQLSSTRATLELVKEQLKREAADREEELHTHHRRRLEEQWDQLMQERDEIIAVIEEKHKSSIDKMKAELESAYKCRNSREQELVDMVSRMQEEDSGKKLLIGDLTTQTESLNENINKLNEKLVGQEKAFNQAQEETDNKIKLLEETHHHACQQLTAAHQQEVDRWKSTAQQLQQRLVEATNKLEQSNDSKLVEELRKALSEKEHQVAQLSKEKHLYQLEVMNRNCHGDSTTVTARQRRRGGRGRPGRPGPSRGQHK